jgi:hypothetical protein
MRRRKQRSCAPSGTPSAPCSRARCCRRAPSSGGEGLESHPQPPQFTFILIRQGVRQRQTPLNRCQAHAAPCVLVRKRSMPGGLSRCCRAVCPDASPDFLALADAIRADLERCGDGGDGDAPAAPPPMRRRSRAALVVNHDAILEEAEEGE